MELLIVLDLLLDTLSDFSWFLIGLIIWALQGFAFDVEVENGWNHRRMTFKGWLE